MTEQEMSSEVSFFAERRAIWTVLLFAICWTAWSDVFHPSRAPSMAARPIEYVLMALGTVVFLYMTILPGPRTQRWFFVIMAINTLTRFICLFLPERATDAAGYFSAATNLAAAIILLTLFPRRSR